MMPETPFAPAGPIPFVVGANRSGTTLLRLMLDAHPALAIPPETFFVPNLIELYDEGKPARDDSLRLITSRPEFGDFGLTADELAAAIGGEPNTARGALLAFYGAYAAKQGKPRFGDKTPGYSGSMRAIEGVLREARFIHIVRDGRDVALSVISRGLQERTIEELAKRWRRRMKRTRRQGGKVERYLEIRYEDLIADTEATLRRVCEFIELEWDAAVLTYHERAAERMGEMSGELRGDGEKRDLPEGYRAEMHATTSQPPDPSRLSKWKREMSPADVQAFERIAGDMLAELGYELVSVESG
jgi:DNA-binding transcriptional ArsR family regulator